MVRTMPATVSSCSVRAALTFTGCASVTNREDKVLDQAGPYPETVRSGNPGQER